jgi:hypothetical protein
MILGAQKKTLVTVWMGSTPVTQINPAAVGPLPIVWSTEIFSPKRSFASCSKLVTQIQKSATSRFLTQAGSTAVPANNEAMR